MTRLKLEENFRMTLERIRLDPPDDNLAIALCTYFSGHSERPDGDEDEDGEGGWSPWTLEKYNGLMKQIETVAASLLTQVRNETLEEAAKVADGVCANYGASYAGRIRSLKSPG